MNSKRTKYSNEELERILEDSDIDDFSDGSDEFYKPDSYNINSSEDTIIAEEPLLDDNTSDEELEDNEIWLEEILPIGREKFIGKAGVQDIQAITDENGSVSLMKVVEYIITDDIIDYMVEKTNNYAEIYKQVLSKISKQVHNIYIIYIYLYTNLQTESFRKLCKDVTLGAG